MTMPRDYPYQSVLAPYICDFITEKRSLGFIYNGKAYQLYRLDQYWLKNNYNDAHMSAERLDKWICRLPKEGRSSQSARISAAKSLATYLTIHGIACDIPLISIGEDHPKIHILDKTELEEFFDAVDEYTPLSINQQDYRMANEYPIMFRLFYCCGMRNNEVCSLRVSDVNFDKGIITVIDGKGNKDRLVYLADDLKKLLVEYQHYIKKTLGYEPYWLFPGRDPDKHIPKNSIDRKFKTFWNKTASSSHCDRVPTPHSLRHGYVVDRINSWMLAGVDLNVMFIYLSKYLGHKSPDESFYYYHLVNDAFRIVRQKDRMASDVLPEVRRR